MLPCFVGAPRFVEAGCLVVSACLIGTACLVGTARLVGTAAGVLLRATLQRLQAMFLRLTGMLRWLAGMLRRRSAGTMRQWRCSRGRRVRRARCARSGRLRRASDRPRRRRRRSPEIRCRPRRRRGSRCRRHRNPAQEHGRVAGAVQTDEHRPGDEANPGRRTRAERGRTDVTRQKMLWHGAPILHANDLSADCVDFASRPRASCGAVIFPAGFC